MATVGWLALSVGAGAAAGWVFHRWSLGSPRLHRWMDDPADETGTTVDHHGTRAS